MLIKFNLTECNANTFVKVDAQIGEECRRTISYLQGYSCPELYCKKQSYQKPTANTVRNTRTELLYAECGATLKNFYLSKLLCFCSSLFEKNRNNAKYSIYRNRRPVFRDGHLLQGGGGGWAGANGVGVIPFCAPENGGLRRIVQPFRLNLTRYLCSEFNGLD